MYIVKTKHPSGCKDYIVSYNELLELVKYPMYKGGYFLNGKKVSIKKIYNIIKNNVSPLATIKISHKWRGLKWSQGDTKYFGEREIKHILSIDVA